MFGVTRFSGKYLTCINYSTFFLREFDIHQIVEIHDV